MSACTVFARSVSARSVSACSVRVRGKPKVSADFSLLAAALNLARLAVLRLNGQNGRWQATTA